MADLYRHVMKGIDGSELPLERFRGQVTLLVNVASACGYTRQYEGLQALHARFAGRGFNVVGVPSNDFGAQEPGSDAEIRTFCSTRYNVAFPMLSKVPVKGAQAAPLYADLAAEGGAPAWNFHKYLVGRDGALVSAFPSKVEPLADELVQAIEAALGR